MPWHRNEGEMSIEEINEVIGRICGNVEVIRSHGWFLLAYAVMMLGFGMLIGIYVGDKKDGKNTTETRPTAPT